MRSVIVTGASRGIGRVVAQEMARRGDRVLCVARGASGLTQTVASIEAEGGAALAHPADLRNEKDVDGVVARAADELGGLDLLVNNAGINVVKPVAKLSLAEWDDVLATNLTATFLMTRGCLELLAARRGVVVNVSSVGGRPGVEKFPGFGAYSASKYGVIGFTEVLALEARERGVRVHALCPGSVDTELLTETLPDATRRLDPLEVARAVAWLAADAPLATTGSVIDLWP